MTHETLNNSQLSFKAAALRMFHLPLSVYGSVAEVSLSLNVLRDTCWRFSFHLENQVVLCLIVVSLYLHTPLSPVKSSSRWVIKSRSKAIFRVTWRVCGLTGSVCWRKNVGIPLQLLVEQDLGWSSPSTVSTGQINCWYLFECLI